MNPRAHGDERLLVEVNGGPLRACGSVKIFPGMVIVVMGPAGAGKTTVGQQLAHELGVRFVDADTLHPAANVAKMRAGLPLDDHDREPWLAMLEALVTGWVQRGDQVVLACSALKQRYRDRLCVDPRAVRFVYLRGSPELLATRLAERKDHFVGPALLPSQLADLEEPADAVVLDAALAPDQLISLIRIALGR